MEAHISMICCILWLELSVLCLKEDNKTETKSPQYLLEPAGLGWMKALLPSTVLLAAALPKEAQLWQALNEWKYVYISDKNPRGEELSDGW